MTKSDNMYKGSPKIEKNSDGKPGIKRPSKADGEGMGLEGSPLEGAGDGMPIDLHEKERVSMHKRHQEEQKGMHDRHEKDLKEMHGRHHEANTQEKLTGDDANIEGTK